jgi:hypothetical protein
MLPSQPTAAAPQDEAKPATAGESAQEQEKVERPELREALLVRMAKDQEVRQKTVAWMKQNKISFNELPKDYLQAPVMQEELRTDRENRDWLKTIVERHGWPGKGLVGTDGAHAAWLLVQHADLDFQRDCLRRMEQCPDGEVATIDLAYLTDRVRLAEGKPQIYGTQIEIKEGRWQPSRVEDPANLDRRRKEIGLPPIAEYLKQAEEVYGPPSQAADNPDEKRPH